jgi:hypothetical protein
MFTRREVDKLLHAVYRLRQFGDRIETTSRHADVAIDIACSADGSVVVFPAVATA